MMTHVIAILGLSATCGAWYWLQWAAADDDCETETAACDGCNGCDAPQ